MVLQGHRRPDVSLRRPDLGRQRLADLQHADLTRAPRTLRPRRRGRPHRGTRPADAGGCVIVGDMFAQQIQNWWWTALRRPTAS
ncbi:trp operon leader peptide [Streptomyces pristinaespiralis]|nr:trp operon leader peptide [Streptomyces pristinaespiralis]